MSGGKHLTITIPQFPNFKIFIHKFENVKNSPEIRKNLLEGNNLYNFSFINSKTVISIEQLTASIYRTLLDHTNHKIRTRTLHSEVIFSLSPTQNIMDALKKFGIQDDTDNLIVVRITDREEGTKYDLSIVEGDEVVVEDGNFEQSSDVKLIKKIYKLDSTEPDLLTRQIVTAIQLRGH